MKGAAVVTNFVCLFSASFFNVLRSEVEFSIDDFNTVGGRVPLITNVKPHGKV